MLEQKDNPNLDLLRALAVSMVLVFHLLRFYGISTVHGSSLAYLGLGGVLFFFVHTCLVLMFSLERLQKRYRGFQLYMAFIVRRIFRIYPLSVLAVVLIVLLHLPLGGLTKGTFHAVIVTPLGLLSNIFLTQNITNTESVLGPLWSLPFEMQMYVLLPLLFLWSLRSRSTWPLVFLWFFSALLGWVDIHFGHMPDLVRYIPCFLPGVIAYKLGERSHARVAYYLWPPFLLALVAVLIYLGTMEAGWFVCLLIGLAIPQFKLLAARWLRVAVHVLAKYSYGIYLGHYLCMWLALSKLHDRPWVVQWLVLVVTLALVPVAFFHLIEEPMINQGSRLVDILFRRKSVVSGGSLEAQVP
jgi:peptidoglycan/LPS O-acetylase OafA/YrhL